MYTIEQIIDFCNNFTIRNDSFAREIGRKICKYLDIYNVDDNFYNAITYFFYKDIHMGNVIINKNMFKHKKFYKHCYENLVDYDNIRCINCLGCKGCIDCIDCIDCLNCLACEGSILCRECTLCINCMNCDHCIQSKYLQDESSYNEQNFSLIIS